jgi:type IV secretion system protein VirD4
MAGLYIGGGYKVEKQMHAIVVAGSGQGKGVCFVLPNLLICPHNSWFITDIKGENAMITARFQQEAGQKVAILDPWGEQMRLGATHGIAPIGFNPLTFIVSNPKEMPESAGIIAHLLVPDATGKDEYWASRARSLIKTYLLHIVTALPEEDQHLGTLYDWLRLSIKDRGAIWLDMRANTECRGLVRKGISEFFDLNPHDGPLPSIISTAQDNTVFLESEALQISLSQNGLDPYDLTDGKTTVYVCLPERFLDTHDRWLRLVTGVCLKACNYRPKERVNFLLDEFAILGKMKEIQRAFAFSRGNKINVTILVQGLGQLFEIYGQHGTNAFLSNARLRQFFGINDLDTQKYLSEYLGETTIKTFSQTKSQSKSSSETYNGDGEIEVLSSWSNGVSDTETFIARRLRTSEEIGKMPDIITFLDSYKFRLIRMPYWDNIYTAHLSGRGQYSPYNQEDWHRFLDELEGKREKRPEYRMNDQFIQRLQTGPNSIDDSQKMDI